MAQAADEPGMGLLLALAALHAAPDGACSHTPWQQPEEGRQALQADAEWEEHFLFDFIKQSYLITARHSTTREPASKAWTMSRARK
jgi:hypothetical protein